MKIEQNPVLMADEGMALTDGKTYATIVYVGRLDSVDNWREVPIAEMEAWRAAQDAEAEQAASGAEE